MRCLSERQRPSAWRRVQLLASSLRGPEIGVEWNLRLPRSTAGPRMLLSGLNESAGDMNSPSCETRRRLHDAGSDLRIGIPATAPAKTHGCRLKNGSARRGFSTTRGKEST